MKNYVGRFAPSPTGPLHMGSLLAATASYLDAKANGGQWLLRIEDVDETRCTANATQSIIDTLKAFGFKWNGDVMIQSQRKNAYESALNQLWLSGQVYRCRCSRKEIADSAVTGIDGPIYPGTCKHAFIQATEPHAVRLSVVNHAVNDVANHVANEVITFTDMAQGCIEQNVIQAIGDFVLKRRDGLFAYQFAVVIDDAEQDVTNVVRGCDLLLSTPRQIVLQKALGYSTPHYLHTPVLVNSLGQKLSKQTMAQAIDTAHVVTTLRQVLSWLGQTLPSEQSSLEAHWHHAIARWTAAPFRHVKSIVVE